MTGGERKQKHGDKVREREGVRSRKYGGVGEERQCSGGGMRDDSLIIK